MSGNGSNEWGVHFSSIVFLNRILGSHSNVVVLERHDDSVFEIRRIRQGDQLTVICLECYTASLELVMRIVQAFAKVQIIYVGGKWASATGEAYRFCQERQIGIYNAGKLAGGLSRNAYWTYE